MDSKIRKLKKIILVPGVLALILAVMLFAMSMMGFFELGTFALAGNSGIRTLAGLAVTGCLLAAIGYWDE